MLFRSASQRVEESAAGLAELLDLLSTYGDRIEDRVPVAIETTRGLLVAALRTNGRDVYAINPMAVARYRERHTVSRKKSDAQDAAALANILRTDRHAHRPLPQDSELVQSIAVLARAQQDAVWDRQQHANRNRSLLREYFPMRFLPGPIPTPGGRTVSVAEESAVPSSSNDVPVPDRQRPLGTLLHVLRLNLEDTEPDLRNLDTAVQGNGELKQIGRAHV